MPLVTTKPDGKIPPGAICIYGPSGVGKTTLVGTMPGRGLIVDTPQVEGGTFVLADKASRIDIYTCDEWEKIDEVFWSLQKGEGSYDWVCIDSITGMQKLARDKVVKERDRKLSEDPHKITLNEYGQIGSLVSELVYRFKKVGIWQIWTAQERKHGGGEDDPGPVMIGPDIIRSALAALRPSVMVIGRLALTQNDNGKWDRSLRTGTHDLYMAKCRALPGKKMPAVTSTLHLGKILKYLLSDGPIPKEFKEQEFGGIVLD